MSPSHIRQPMSRYTKCFSTQPTLSMSCPTGPPASCAWSLCSGCTSACLVRASSYEDLLAKTRWHCAALLMLRQKRAKSNPHSDSKRLASSQQLVLVREQPSRQDIGPLLVVPRPCPCHEPAEPLSPILFGALVQLPRTVSGPRKSGSTCARNCC